MSIDELISELKNPERIDHSLRYQAADRLKDMRNALKACQTFAERKQWRFVKHTCDEALEDWSS